MLAFHHTTSQLRLTSAPPTAATSSTPGPAPTLGLALRLQLLPDASASPCSPHPTPISKSTCRPASPADFSQAARTTTIHQAPTRSIRSVLGWRQPGRVVALFGRVHHARSAEGAGMVLTHGFERNRWHYSLRDGREESADGDDRETSCRSAASTAEMMVLIEIKRVRQGRRTGAQRRGGTQWRHP